MFRSDTLVEVGACVLAVAMIPTALLVPLPAPERSPRAHPAAGEARAVEAAARPAVLQQALAPAAAAHPSSARGPAARAEVRDEPGVMVAALPRERPQAVGAAPTSHDLASLHRGQIVELQLSLSQRGLYRGAIDGVAGEQTRAALHELERRRCAARRDALDEGRISPELWAELMRAAPL